MRTGSALSPIPCRDADGQPCEGLCRQLNETCIKTPAEFVAAFQAREPRCVSDTLYGRLASASSLSSSFANITKADFKLAFFISGQDVLEKYIRIGYPQARGEGVAGHRERVCLAANQGSAELAFGRGCLLGRWERVWFATLGLCQCAPRKPGQPAAAALTKRYARPQEPWPLLLLQIVGESTPNSSAGITDRSGLSMLEQVRRPYHDITTAIRST